MAVWYPIYDVETPHGSTLKTDWDAYVQRIKDMMEVRIVTMTFITIEVEG